MGGGGGLPAFAIMMICCYLKAVRNGWKDPQVSWHMRMKTVVKIENM